MDTAVTLQSTIRIPEDVLFQELHGEGVLLNLKTGVYFGLDPVGRRVWQLLQEHATLRAVLDAMLAEYDVAESQCTTDLLTLVTEMRQHHLVTIG
jgi:hypothetical protein